MKKFITLVGICCAFAFAQDGWGNSNGGWDDGSAATTAAQPATESAVQPVEQPVTEPISQPVEQPVAEPVALPAEQPAAQPAASAEGFQWNPTGDTPAAAPAQPAPAPVAAPAQSESFMAFSAQPSAPAETPVYQSRKKLFFGIFASGTYNDFYDTKLGLGSLGKGSKDYTIETSGTDDLLGNFWGLGYNAGLSVLFMPRSFVGVHLEVGGAYRWARGESDMSVILTWNDKDRQAEKADLSIDYYVKQLRVDVPLFARFALPDVAFLEIGPQASFAIYSKSRTFVDDDFGHQEFREHDIADVFELDAVAGVGTTKHIGSKSLDMSLRFVMGITALNDANDAPKTWQGQFNLTFWFL